MTGREVFFSTTGPGESEQSDRYTAAGDALTLPAAVIADVIRIFTSDTPVPEKGKANIGFVCLCVCQLVFVFSFLFLAASQNS